MSNSINLYKGILLHAIPVRTTVSWLYTIRSVRNNQDIPVNKYGQQMLDLCMETKLKVLNARMHGSAVNLVLASETSLTK